MSTAPAFKRVKSITLPVLKLKANETRYLAFLGAMHVGKKIDDQKEAATIARCVDMETGEEGQVICSTVMKKELEENYPNHGYVGLGFEITLTKVPEKRYNIPSIAEVSIPEELAPQIAAMVRQGGAAPAPAKQADKPAARK